MACPACGTVNAATNTFCVNCGTRLGSVVPAAPGFRPAGPPPAAPPPYVPYPTPYPYYAPFPRRATFSDMLSGLFDVWTKNFLPFFVVYLALGAATGALGAVVSYAIFGTVSPGGGFFGVPSTGLPTGTRAVPQHPWGQPPARAPHLRTHHPSIRLDHIRLRRGSERGGERRRPPLWWAHPVGRARRPGALPVHLARPIPPRDHDGE